MVSKIVAYEKVLKCIKSCVTYAQWIGSLKMIQNHFKLYKDYFLDKSLRYEHKRVLKNNFGN